MNKVYITNTAGHDFTKAEEYGEIHWITKGFVSFQSLDRLKYSIAKKLKDTTPDDFLLISGTSTVSVICALVWYQMHKKVKILVHSRNDNDDYRLLVVTEKNLTDIFDLLKNDSTETSD